MSTQFSILNEHEAILISMTGHVSEEDINEMRLRTTEIAAETGFSRFVMDIEDVFGVDIPDEAAEKLLTVGDILKYLEENI